MKSKRIFQSVSFAIAIHLCCQEVELKVSLMKSDKGSLGFTLTKGNDHGCYIHDIIQDPAKGDGRLRAGDRMIMVGVSPCLPSLVTSTMLKLSRQNP